MVQLLRFTLPLAFEGGGLCFCTRLSRRGSDTKCSKFQRMRISGVLFLGMYSHSEIPVRISQTDHRGVHGSCFLNLRLRCSFSSRGTTQVKTTLSRRFYVDFTFIWLRAICHGSIRGSSVANLFRCGRNVESQGEKFWSG